MRCFFSTSSTSQLRDLASNDLLDLDAQTLGYPDTVVRVGLVEMTKLPNLNKTRHRLQRASDVADELRFLVGIHQAEQVTCLTVILIAITMVIAVGITSEN